MWAFSKKEREPLGIYYYYFLKEIVYIKALEMRFLRCSSRVQRFLRARRRLSRGEESWQQEKEGASEAQTNDSILSCLRLCSVLKQTKSQKKHPFVDFILLARSLFLVFLSLSLSLFFSFINAKRCCFVISINHDAKNLCVCVCKGETQKNVIVASLSLYARMFLCLNLVSLHTHTLWVKERLEEMVIAEKFETSAFCR
jgi:hypothetical protein